MAEPYTVDRVINALLAGVRAEMEQIVVEEAEAAAERVRKRTKELAPKLALALFQNFDIARNQHEIVIRVRQEPTDG